MTDRPRNIFLVANNFEELGGLQRVMHRLASAFAKRGHNVELIGIDHAESPHDYGSDPTYRRWVLNEVREARPWQAKNRRDRLDLPSRLREARRIRAHTDAVHRLSQRFASVPDGVVIVGRVWAMDWVAEAETSHLHVIGMSHESHAASRASHRYRRIRSHYPDLDAFLLLTEADARSFERDGFTNVGVMPNPLSFFPDRTSDLALPRIVAAGRYSVEKGFDQLIDAFALAADRLPGWHVEIFGAGPEHDALQRHAESLGLNDRVRLPGLANDIESELLRGTIFALPSRHEGLPMALAEAMACGVPTVAFDCAPGVRELVADGVDGLVLPPGDVEEMADAFVRLAHDEVALRDLGAQARVSMRRFEIDEIMARWESLFAEIER